MRRSRTTRRALLGRLGAVAAAGLAGCGRGRDRTGSSTRTGGTGGGRSASTDGDVTDRDATDGHAGDTDAAGTDAGDGLEQVLAVHNPNATAAYATVAAEAEGGETAFVESLALTPGERRRARVRLPGPGPYRVVAETAAGAREEFAWNAEARLDGIEATLRADAIALRRTATCGDGCELSSVTDRAELPLSGSGIGRWYAPASVVLENPGRTERTAAVSVDFGGDPVVDAAYVVPARTRVEIPVTYRTGDYRVRVRSGGRTTASTWRVPAQPSLHVDLADGGVGCGPANTELLLGNADDVERAVAVTVRSGGGTRLFETRAVLPAGGRESVVPVSESGRYRVRVQVDDAPPFEATWWACPPRGMGIVAVDATGEGAFR